MIRCPNCGHENVDGAKACANCGFTLDWRPDPPPPDPTVPLEVALTLDPGHAHVAPGGQVTVRLGTALPERLAGATWAVVGEAEPFADVAGTGEALRVTLHPGPEERPRTVQLKIVAVGMSPVASAGGTLEITPAREIAGSGATTDDGGGRGALIAAAAAIVIVLLLGGWTAYVLATRDTVTILARHGVCEHTQANVSASTRISQGSGCVGPNQGEKVSVRCDDAGNRVYRLSSFLPWRHRWITDSAALVAAPSDVSAC